ncbi:MAG TPA: terminase small subunit [Anaeromyxobacteraceae bacterium]|nr:terminase small subunit [Anaeromyxobacteraceae bacterium]
MALTPKQRKFVQELMVDENARQAAIRAGYSPKSAEVNGPRLCRQPSVRAAIEAARLEAAQRTQLRQEEVIAELKRIIFADPRKAFDAEGNPIPIHELPEDVARAIAATKVRVEDVPGQTLDDGAEVKARAVASVKEWKWWDKTKGLELAMRHLGLLRDKVEHSGKDGEPLEVRVTLVREGEGER